MTSQVVSRRTIALPVGRSTSGVSACVCARSSLLARPRVRDPGMTASPWTSPRPIAKPPPRWSVIGSQSAAAHGPHAITVPPRSTRSDIAWNSGVSLSTLRRWLAESPARNTACTPSMTAAASESSASARVITINDSTVTSIRAPHASAAATSRAGCSKASAVGSITTRSIPAPLSSCRSSSSLLTNGPPPWRATTPPDPLRCMGRQRRPTLIELRGLMAKWGHDPARRVRA